MSRLCLLAACLTVSCVPEPTKTADSDTGTGADTGADTDPDADNDGYPASEDCNDADANISPSASDVVGDGIDQNCDGVDGTDTDGDGVAGVMSGGTDCDDSDDSVYPEQTERLFDGVDNNCDAVVDIIDVADATVVVEGGADEQLGRSIAYHGCDFDQDGETDLAIGTYGYDGLSSDIGGARIISGSTLEGLSSGQPLIDDTADYTLEGVQSGERAGYSVSCGDMDGDMYPDLAISAQGHDLGVGRAYVVAGPLGSGALAGADLIADGESAEDQAGALVSLDADFDGDGRMDLAFSATGREYGSNNYAGTVYLIYGAATFPGSLAVDASSDVRTIEHTTYKDIAGSGLAAGDADGDGLGDLLVGARQGDHAGNNAGDAYFVSGADLAALSAGGTTTLASLGDLLMGSASGDCLGDSASILPDIDGDGHDELALSAFGYGSSTTLPTSSSGTCAGFESSHATPTGGLFLISYPSTGGFSGCGASVDTCDFLRIVGDSGDIQHLTPPTADDLDGDGHVDLGVGVYPDQTAIFLLGAAPSGTLQLSDADATLTGSRHVTTLDDGRLLSAFDDHQGSRARSGGVFLFSGWQ